MADKKTKRIGSRIRLDKVTLNWARHLFEIDDGDNGNKKYGCDLLIDKKNTATVSAFYEAFATVIRQAAEAGMLDGKAVADHMRKAKALKPVDTTMFGWPLKDGDAYATRRAEQGKDSEEYRGHWYLSVSSNNQPRLFDRDAKRLEDTPSTRDLFHSGAVVNATLFVFAYEPGRFVKLGGGSAWLNGVQYVAEGEHFGGDGDSGFVPLDDTDTTGTDDDGNTAGISDKEVAESAKTADWGF